jgi:hypothetical protein
MLAAGEWHVVEVAQLLLKLFLAQVVQPAFVSDECFDFVPQQPEPGVAVNVAFPEVQLACSDCRNDLFLRQTELLPNRFVAQGGSLLGPHRIAIGHASFLRNSVAIFAWPTRHRNALPLQVIPNPLLGRTEAQLLLHQLEENRLVLFWQDDPGEERVQRQAEVSNAFFAFSQIFDEPFDAIVFFWLRLLQPLSPVFADLKGGSRSRLVLDRFSVNGEACLHIIRQGSQMVLGAGMQQKRLGL